MEKRFNLETSIITDDLLFPEGPIYLNDGSILLVEIARGTLTKVYQNGKKEIVSNLGEGPNGAAIGPDGFCYICNNGGFDWEISSDQKKRRPIAQAKNYKSGKIQKVNLNTGEFETLYSECNGLPLNGPNDIVFDKKGNFWFTDLGKVRERTMDRGSVYWAKPDGSKIKEVIHPIMTPNGALFKTNVKGFLPELMEDMYNDRVIYKKKMLEEKQQYEDTKEPSLLKKISKYDNIQMARKIALNSAYGAIGNQYFRYYSLAMAEAVTTSGQLSIRWIENKVNEYMNDLLKTDGKDYVIASDTDSIYVTFGDLIDKFKPKSPVDFLDIIAKEKIEPFINKSYQELADYTHAFDQKMFMKREVIADKGIWTAKKRYILNVWDSEGVRYEEPKLKMMGIEAVKSSTPAPCRKMIKDALNIMMSGTEEDVIKFIDDSRVQFKKLPPEDIAFPRTVSNVNKHKSTSSIYAKGTPIHARGALLYNHHIKDKKLDNKYSLINNGEKIKFCYLKKPNWIHENVISFISDFPTELDLDKSIDYELQFEKAFLEPVKVILDAIGWNVEKVVNLELFFS